jgi:uncharacterized protein YggE
VKKIWLTIAGVVLILVVVGLVGCSSGNTPSNGNVNVALNNQQEGIWVTGEGKVTAVPDVAVISLGIQSQETTVEAAQAKAAAAMDDVMKALENAGIERTDIQTQYFNIQKVTRWDNDKQQEVVIGFQVTNTVTAKVRDVTKAGSVIDAVVAAGGDLTRIDSISFTVDDPTQYQEQARVKAVNDAAAKAKQLADTAGVKLGNPTYITENTYVPGPIYRDVMTAEAAPTPTTPISPGEMEITASVQIAYSVAK